MPKIEIPDHQTGKPEEITAPFGLDFLTTTGRKYNIRIEGTQIVIKSCGDDLAPMIISPVASNIIILT